MAAFYVALFIIRPWEEMVPFLGQIHFERFYALAMVAVVLLNSKFRGVFTPQTGSVLVLLAALTLSAVLAIDSTIAWDPWYVYVTLVVFYFVLVLVIRTPYELLFMVTCYIVAMEIYLAKSEWEFFVNDRHDFKMGVRRLIGVEITFGDPNAVGMSIAVSLPILWYLFSIRKTLTARWPSLWRKLFPVALGIYLFLAISSIILTRSRSGMLTGVIFVGILALRSKSWSKKILAGLGGVVFLVLLWLTMSDEARNRLRTVWDPDAGPANATTSAHGRVEGLQAGLAMVQKYPLTGVGMGNFIPYRIAHVDGIPLLAHNLPGQVLGEAGLLGFTAFFLMVFVMCWNCRTIRRLCRDSTGPLPVVLSGFAVACENSILLLLFEGLSLHNMNRFNWLWLAAFISHALLFATVLARQRGRQPVGTRGPEVKWAKA
jgi:O-antigen ligase